MNLSPQQVEALRSERGLIRASFCSVSQMFCNLKASANYDAQLARGLNDIKRQIARCMEIMAENQKIFMKSADKWHYTDLQRQNIANYQQQKLQEMYLRQQWQNQRENKQMINLQQIEDQQRQIIVQMDIYLADLKKFQSDHYEFGQSVVQSPFAAFAFAYLGMIMRQQNQIESVCQYKQNILLADLSYFAKEMPSEINSNPANIKGLIFKIINMLKQFTVRQIKGEYDLMEQLFDVSLMANLTQQVVDAVFLFKQKGMGNFGFNVLAQDFGIRILSQKENQGIYEYQFMTMKGNVFYILQNLKDGGFIFQ